MNSLMCEVKIDECGGCAGKSPWRREEALAYILAVELVDLPVSENEAKFEDEFGSSKGIATK